MGQNTFVTFYCWILGSSVKFREFPELEDNGRQEWQQWLRFFRNIQNSGLEMLGSWMSRWSLGLCRKSSRFLPDFNYSFVQWDGGFDLPPTTLLCGDGVISRGWVAVVKWGSGTVLEGSDVRSHLHLWELTHACALYAKLLILHGLPYCSPPSRQDNSWFSLESTSLQGDARA